MTEPTQSQDSPAPTMASASESSTPARRNYGPLSFSTPIVTISVKGGEKFYVHKSILTQDSEYFKKALNGSFLEGNSNSINLDHIGPKAFGHYVDILYAAAYKNVKLYDEDIAEEKQQVSSCFTRLLEFWKLADYFMDPKMKAIAEDGINFRLTLLSVRGWENYYNRCGVAANLTNRFTNLQKEFRYCKENNMPYQDQLVTALANCPPQVFAEHVDDLDNDEFKSAVIKAFALRFVECRSPAEIPKTVFRRYGENTDTRALRKRKLGQD